MAHALRMDRLDARGHAAQDIGELARKLALIEDRPDGVLTWSDVSRHTRALWRRLAAGGLRSR
jgi:hypothetical protein